MVDIEHPQIGLERISNNRAMRPQGRPIAGNALNQDTALIAAVGSQHRKPLI
jgi:hypothetical protein